MRNAPCPNSIPTRSPKTDGTNSESSELPATRLLAIAYRRLMYFVPSVMIISFRAPTLIPPRSCDQQSEHSASSIGSAKQPEPASKSSSFSRPV